MTVQSIHKQLKCSITSLALSVIPVLMLVFTLIKSGYWGNALNALRGKYTILGVPSNPWRDFTPLFSFVILVLVGSSWLAAIIAKGSQPSLGRSMCIILLNLLASIAFGMSMVFASISYLWFQSASVIGQLGSPILFWSSLCFSLIVLVMNCYRLMLSNSALS